MNNQEQLIAQASTLISAGEKVLGTETSSGQSKSLVSELKFHDFRIASLSYLSRVFGETNTYYQSFRTEVTHHTASRTRRGIGMLSAAKKELQSDWLATTSGAVCREQLIDMLRLARMQFELNNHLAAAVIAGTILEQQLRNLCQARGVEVHNEIQGKAIAKRGLQLTGEAYKKKLYDRQDNKIVIGWLELYEAAVKGNDEQVPPAKVKNMLKDLLTFLSKIRY